MQLSQLIVAALKHWTCYLYFEVLDPLGNTPAFQEMVEFAFICARETLLRHCFRASRLYVMSHDIIQASTIYGLQ